MIDQTEATRAVVAAYVAALQSGDLPVLHGMFAADATWTLRGDLPTSGVWTGPDEILGGFLAGMMERLDPTAGVRQVLHRIIADGDTAVAEWASYATTIDGVPYANDYAVAFRIVDDRIAEVREYFDTAYAQRVMFAGVSSG